MQLKDFLKQEETESKPSRPQEIIKVKAQMTEIGTNKNNTKRKSIHEKVLCEDKQD